MVEALLGFAAMLVLAFLRVPIAFAMALTGFVGFGLMVNWNASIAMVGHVTFDTGMHYELVVLPLFILMGTLVTRAGFSEALYKSAYSFFGHNRGGLAMATVVACGGFSAVCGSSLATAATMVKVAVPPMRRYGYHDRLAAGSIAAGGTLGILIPPSVILVLYGVITETNIGALFMAGLLPGIAAVVLFLIAIRIMVAFKADWGPAGERTSWPARLAALRDVWGVLLLFLLVMGGIYGGAFTATEASGIGAAGALLLAVLRRSLTIRGLFEVLYDSLKTTGMMFAVLIGALIFSNFINIAGLPTAAGAWVSSLNLSVTLVLVLLLLMYVLLGSVLDTLAMMLLTVPAIFPAVVALGVDPIWFGIFIVIVTEIGMLTPPIGMNVFVIKATMRDVRTNDVFIGVIPFWIAHMVLAIILIAVPALALMLPSMMSR